MGIKSFLFSTVLVGGVGVSIAAAVEPPRNLQVLQATYRKITLAWQPEDAQVQIAGYKVFRNQEEIATVNVPYFTDEALQPGTEYSYTVVAVTSGGARSEASVPLTTATLKEGNFDNHAVEESVVDDLHGTADNWSGVAMLAAVKGGLEALLGGNLTGAVIDDRLAHVVYFEQKENINSALYRGELYIDTENNALLRAHFEINPKYIKQATGMLVEKKSRNLKITPQKVIYTVTYKPYNGQYYINHVRGDLFFRIKKRKQLFGTFPLHTWFEMVTCKIDTNQVSRFARSEALPTRTIFAETQFAYDEKFWGNFNVIPPEEKLNEAIGKISSKIEETEE